MFNEKVYSERRNKLRKQINNGIILILGNNDSPMNYPANIYHFRQDSNFLYFFGIDMPGMAGIIDVDKNQDIIFGNDIDIEDIIWTGPQENIKSKALKAGINITEKFEKLSEYIESALKQNRKIHFLPQYRTDNKILLSNLLNIHIDKLKENTSVELIKAIVNIRSIKEKIEIEEIERYMEVAYIMHTTAMQMAKPGVHESAIAGTIEGIALSCGGSVSFPIILSVRGETLHGHDHSNIMKDGDLLLVDAGVESPLHYATDHTRVVPVSGKFTQKQKEIYQIVLDSQMAAIEAIKPGITYQSIHLIACKVIAEGLKNIGLMKGDTDEAVKQGAHAFFFPHGLGHMMGLDVHDMEDIGQNYVGYDEEIKPIDQFGTAYLRLGRRLQEGFVLTVEPGIYFIPALIDLWKAENKFAEFINYEKVENYRTFGGIRIEDDILVTANGYKVLGRPIPKTIDEIENFIKS
ncbi:MAG: aminopeptidase P family protein [Bacteroidetes bacterium]|nr:aminopeptidase P family protein [Bacteroidota bacterium]